MGEMLGLFNDFLTLIEGGQDVPRIAQGPGHSATKSELLKQLEVDPSDDPEVVERKVRAFWYPPQTGATIEVAGRRYTLVSEEILRDLGRYLHSDSDSDSDPNPDGDPDTGSS